MAVKKLSRRTFLRAGQGLIALPLLEAMLPFGRTAFAATETPLRFGIVFWPHGTTQSSDWDPSLVNGVLKMNPSGMVNALSPYAADISFIKNLFPDSYALHPGGVATVTVGGFSPKANTVQTRKTIDQIIADQLQGSGRVHSLAMGSNEQSGGESIIPGMYGTNISWLSATTPATRYISNAQIFDQIVPGGMTTTQPVADTSSSSRKSMLDFAKDGIARAQASLGSKDKQTLDQYLTGLREVEKKIQDNPDPGAPAGGANLTLNPAMAACSTLAKDGSCADYPTDMDIKMDLMALAFQADRTRVITHMFDPEPGYRNMSFIPGVTGQAHPNSHWRDNPDKLGPMVQKTTAFYLGKFARLLGRLKSMNEVGGTVLDNSLILLCSSMMDGYNHEGTNIPAVLAGRAGGAFKPGAFKVLPSRTNISYLHYTLAKKFGVSISDYAGAKSTIDIG
jgi:hypothetical protein